MYNAALHVMGEEADSMYEARVPTLLNALMAENYPYSEEYDGDRNGFVPVSSMADSIVGMDATLENMVLPYGLAAHLLLDENPEMSNFFEQKYEENLSKYRNSRPGEWETIEDVYGIVNQNDRFGRW